MDRQRLIDDLDTATRSLYAGCGESVDFDSAVYFWANLPDEELRREYEGCRRRCERAGIPFPPQ